MIKVEIIAGILILGLHSLAAAQPIRAGEAFEDAVNTNLAGLTTDLCRAGFE